MSFEDIQTACLIRYPYLWAREAAQGETEAERRDLWQLVCAFPGRAVMR